MGQQPSHPNQSHSQPLSDGYRVASENERRRFARNVIGLGKTKHQPPAKYGSSTAVAQDTLFGELDDYKASSPAKFEMELAYLRSVESLRPTQNGVKEPNSEGYISETVLSTDYEATYGQVYRRSRRRRVAQRTSNLGDENNAPPARFNREVKIQQGEPENGLGVLADAHRDGQLIILDFLDSTVLTGVPAGVPVAELTELPLSTSAPCQTSDSENNEPPPRTQSILQSAVDHESQSLSAAIEDHQSISSNHISDVSPVSTENELSSSQTLVDTAQALYASPTPPVETEPESIGTVPFAVSADGLELSQIIEPFLWNAKCKWKLGHRGKRKSWATVVESLETAKFSLVPDDRYLSVTHLLKLARQTGEAGSDPFNIVDYLRHLAIRWDFETLAETYLDRKQVWMTRPPFSPVPMDGLKCGRYTVSSFFNAAHIIATKAMPSNRSLAEYIAISILLGKLIARLFERMSTPSIHDSLASRKYPVPLISTSISILACLQYTPGGNLSPLSRATIGFSLTGAKKRRAKLMKERRLNLPSLGLIEAREGMNWDVGNCAEPEVFAHMESMYQDMRKDARTAQVTDEWKKLSVCLTLNLKEGKDEHTMPMKGKRLCKYCRELAEKVSKEMSCETLDMAFLDEESP